MGGDGRNSMGGEWECENTKMIMGEVELSIKKRRRRKCVKMERNKREEEEEVRRDERNYKEFLSLEVIKSKEVNGSGRGKEMRRERKGGCTEVEGYLEGRLDKKLG